MDTPFSNTEINPDGLPRIQTLAYHKPDKRYLNVSMIETGLFSFFLLIGISVFFIATGFWEKTWLLVLLPVAWFLNAVVSLVMTYLGFERRGYAIREKDITYKYGVIRHQLVSIPFTRIQHCEVNQGMVERAFSLSTLRIYTAGGSGSDLVIPGLNPETAKMIKDFLLGLTETGAETESGTIIDNDPGLAEFPPPLAEEDNGTQTDE